MSDLSTMPTEELVAETIRTGEEINNFEAAERNWRSETDARLATKKLHSELYAECMARGVLAETVATPFF